MNEDLGEIQKSIGAMGESLGNMRDSMASMDEKTVGLEKNYTEMARTLACLGPLVARHEEIAATIDVQYLENINDHHAYIAGQIARENFWIGVRDRSLERGIWIFVLCIIAGALYAFGFEDFAKKIIGS